MSAYVIVDIEVRNPERYAEYINLTPATIARYGGKFLVRAGRHETLEGSWQPKRFVMLEFESIERAKAWWASEEYREAKALRQSAAATNMIVVEGTAAPVA